VSNARRIQNWLIVAAVGVGLVSAAILGIITFVKATKTTIHANVKSVPSVMGSAPLPPWTAAAEQARQVVRTSVVTQELPGISVAVGVGGDIVWAEGFGWADMADKVPVAPETRFRIGHVSKALTSAAVGLLREQGRLHLDGEIQEYVPAFPKKQWRVTLRQLMGHVAGVRHYKDTEWGDKPSVHCERASEGLSSFANDPLLFEPETKYSYSTYGWVLVSAAIEAVAGEPFVQFMRTKVFDPLGMVSTIADAPNERMPNRATSYFEGNLGNTLTTKVDYSCFAGGGAFLSTPTDLARFAMAMMKGTLLQPDTVSVLQTRQHLTSGEETSYGLGWNLENIDLAGERTRMASHASRTIEGASTSFLTFPDRGLVVAVTSNISFADMRSIALAVAEAFARAITRK